MQFATYYDGDGGPLGDGGFSARGAAMAHLATGRPVYARLDRARPDIRAAIRTSQPNYFLPLDKAGIDPFTQKYPVRAVLEGTVRGTGGIRITGTDCASDVPGLFAAGDAATRELITGGRSGGGSHNGAWAISSGTWAGAGAARFARGRPGCAARPPGGKRRAPSSDWSRSTPSRCGAVTGAARRACRTA
ncbi:FAD-binding protein [Rhodococcus pseudokoreensis]|uniref:FAD-binding protein n=1 Tax=Rhodococcus pseudokoreensis TaxID=2811421 RepID=UPI001F124159|nr:FAD-binding protein [Rhodococcus pseudokoreensis]